MAGVFIAFFGNAPPFRLNYVGLGELATGIGSGPLIVLGSYYVQAQRATYEALWASIPVGLLGAAILWINQFPDYEADRDAGKLNCLVRLGRDRSRYIYSLLMLGPYAVVLLWVLTQSDAWPYLAVILTIPIALKAIKILSAHYQTYDEIIPAQALTIQTHLALGLVFAAALVFQKLVL